MNSFEIQSEADAEHDRKNIRDVLSSVVSSSQSRSNTVTSVINQFNGSAATPSRSKAHADARRLNSPNGKIVNVIDEHVYAVFISCIEIYNNYIYDLLDEFSSTSDSSGSKWVGLQTIWQVFFSIRHLFGFVWVEIAIRI